MGGESLQRYDLHSSEPLYQTYRATVITQEIRRQISKTSMDFAADWAARQTGAGTGNEAPRGSPVAPPAQSTLWQDLPSVRESGVLEQLSAEECKYQEVSGEACVHTGDNPGAGPPRPGLHRSFTLPPDM